MENEIDLADDVANKAISHAEDGEATANNTGYSLVSSKFLGKKVRVYLCPGGAVLSGVLLAQEGRNIYISQPNCKGLEAIVNLDHVVSITKG